MLLDILQLKTKNFAINDARFVETPAMIILDITMSLVDWAHVFPRFKTAVGVG